MRLRVAIVLAALVVGGCASSRPAPVGDRPVQPDAQMPRSEPAKPAEAPLPEMPIPTHTVKRGETLVGIALQYGLDYRELAAWNGITNPNQIAVGRVLALAAARAMQGDPAAGTATPLAGSPVTTPLASARPVEARPLSNTDTVKVEPRAQKVPFSERALAQLSSGNAPAPVPPVAMAPPVAPPATEPDKPSGTDREDVDWMWPSKGKAIAPFTESPKGVDIGGKKGQPVLAAAGGRVVYAGEGLRGYGKLVIIKHNNTWLSAYAHNDNSS
jgi:Membrane proteins related to metalloendopeptidases